MTVIKNIIDIANSKKYLLFLMIVSSIWKLGFTNDCISNPADLIIFEDGTKNVDVDRRKRMDQLASNISVSLPYGSAVYVNSLSDRVETIVSFDKTSRNLNWVDKLPIRNEMKQFGHTLSAVALDNELKTRFSVSQYKSRAEIVVLFVSDASNLDALPSFLANKKTFVVVFGSFPGSYRSIASREDHLYVVGSNGELENVSVKILEQIACDSELYCDTDMYSLKKGSRCKTCSSLCGVNLTQLTDACKTRCPFIGSSNQDPEVKPSTVIYLESVTEDNKDLVIAFVVGGILMVVSLLVSTACCWYKFRKKSASDDTLLKTVTPHAAAPDKIPVQVEDTGMDTSLQEETSLLKPHGSDVGSAQADTTYLASTDSNEQVSINSEGDYIPLPFKNNEEFDLNAHYSEHDVVFLHEPNKKLPRRGTEPSLV